MIILIDNNGILIRYAAALQNDPIENRQKLGGLLLYFQLIKKLMIKYPEAQFITFSDRCGKRNFRKKILITYKEHRAQLSSSVMQQMIELDAYLNEVCIANLFHEEYEADDLIASFISRDPSRNYLIISGDKDFMQLVNENVSIFNPFNNKNDIIIDSNIVYEKYKILPKDFVLYQALMGDSSDNIRGIEGIGPISAAKLINQYSGNIDNIINNVTKYNFSDINIYIQLVTLKRDIDLGAIFAGLINLGKINKVILSLQQTIYEK